LNKALFLAYIIAGMADGSGNILLKTSKRLYPAKE